jgi:hypothetical protein
VGREEVEAGARRFALALGRALEVALLAGHAHWALHHAADARPAAAARRLAAAGIERLMTVEPDDTLRLALDERGPH